MDQFQTDQLVSLLDQTPGAPRAAVDAVQYHGLASLLRGNARTIPEIASISGVGRDQIEQAVEALDDAGRIETDDNHITGVGGLTLNETTHRLTLPEAVMYTWCALDAVGIPVALGLDASVVTTCPHCGETIDVDVSAGTAASPDSDPYLLLPSVPCENVRADFCASANLFCQADHLDAWRTCHGPIAAEVLDLEAAASIGKQMWGRYVEV